MKDNSKLSNPKRFWAGVIMGLIEVGVIILYGLTLLDWSWYSVEMAVVMILGTLIIGYNVYAGVLIWIGSRKR